MPEIIACRTVSSTDGLPRLSCHIVKNGEPDMEAIYYMLSRKEETIACIDWRIGWGSRGIKFEY